MWRHACQAADGKATGRRTLRRRSGFAASLRLKCSCRNLALYACVARRAQGKKVSTLAKACWEPCCPRLHSTRQRHPAMLV